MATDPRNDRVGDVLYWIGSAGIFRVTDITIIRGSGSADPRELETEVA